MNLDQLNRISIYMKDGKEYLNLTMIPNVTNVQSERLIVNKRPGVLLVLNWADVREVYMYEDSNE